MTGEDGMYTKGPSSTSDIPPVLRQASQSPWLYNDI